VGRGQAEAIVAALPHCFARLWPSRDLAEHALGIAIDFDHPAYDGFYLACAAAAGGVLITADTRLASVVEKVGLSSLVQRLGMPLRGYGKEESLPPLKIFKNKIEHIIRASELLNELERTITKSHPDNKISEGLYSPSVSSMKMYFESPTRRALLRYIDDLSSDERIDLLALFWFGRHGKSDWASAHSHARTNHNENTNDYLTGKTVLAKHLRAGLTRLQSARQGTP
ncbi:MAG: DUF3775 domain-containing protein, partial [Alphaproteobacteria bacterium]